MAPIEFFNRIKHLYSETSEPALSKSTAVLLSTFFTLLYVIPFYVSPSTRPSPTLSRDAPSVIKARIRAVTTSCFLSSVGVFCLIVYKNEATPLEALRLLGWWPVGPLEICKSLLLTAILFMGPLFERGIAEGRWKAWVRGEGVAETLGGWIGWRNYVAGPFTEEVIFRSIIVPIHLMTDMSPAHIVFITPLYFGIAHVHHFYEFRLIHPYTSILPSILRSVFQFTYTTIFGWFATFLYLRTGSLPAVFLVHAFCNYCGLPRLWGRVEAQVPVIPNMIRGKEDPNGDADHDANKPLGLGWTIAYYLLLVAGAVAFRSQIWTLTESTHALASFGKVGK